MNFLNKIAKAVSNQRAEKKFRISHLSELIYDQLKDDLVGLNSFVKNTSATRRDLHSAGKLVIRRILDSAWKNDGVVTDRQYELMQWLSNALNISSDQMNNVIKEKATSRLVELMKRRFTSERFNEKDRRHFEHVLSISGQKLNEFVQQPLLSESYWHFYKAVGRINWDNTSSAVTRYRELVDESVLFFGFSKTQWAGDFAKNVLDKKISAINKKRCVSEEDVNELAELVEAFDVKNIPTNPTNWQSNYSEDIERKLQHLRSMTGLKRGKLPIIPTPYGITPKVDETVHAAFEARLLHYTRSRLHPHFYEGMFVVLNKRAIFQDGVGYIRRSSARRDLTFSYSGILNLDPIYSSGRNEFAIRVEVTNQGTHADETFEIRFNKEYVLDAKVFEGAVDFSQKSHLTKKNISERPCSPEPPVLKPIRHSSTATFASRWEACGGRCVECGSVQLVSFDRIISQSKGGRIEEQDIPLRCRRCNLEKSDSV